MRSLAVFISIFLLFGFLVVTESQSHKVTKSQVSDYEPQWAKVDSLFKAGLPKSALAVVDDIYDNARIESNDPQVVKSILYRIRLNADFQENFPLPAIREVQGELIHASTPVRQILHSILGELYWNYYRMNQYRFQNRSYIPSFTSDDPETWDRKTLIYNIILHYRKSLKNEHLLWDIPIGKYQAILENPIHEKEEKDPTTVFRPTLFDFLAHRALEFFTISDLPVSESVHAFSLNNSAFFHPTAKFIKYPLQPKGIHSRPGGGSFVPPGIDTLSLSWYAVSIYQVLDRFHFNDKDPRA